MAKIIKITIQGLFGSFDHAIPLNEEEHVTIMNGPNGFGKTTTLQLLNSFFASRYTKLLSAPFESITLDFDDQSCLLIQKISDSHETRASKRGIKIVRNAPSQAPDEYVWKSKRLNPRNGSILNLVDDIIPTLQRVGTQQWFDTSTGEHLSLEAVAEKYDQIDRLLSGESSESEEPEWLKKLKETTPVRLIETQRLLKIGVDSSSSINRYSRSWQHNLPESTAASYSKELASTMKQLFQRYGEIAQNLDKTYPIRIVKNGTSSDLSNDDLKSKLEELQSQRDRLTAVGLLDPDTDGMLEDIQPEQVDPSTKSALAIYIEDVEKKLDVFSEILEKLELLKRILDKKFIYSRKQVLLSKEDGFMFKISRVKENDLTIPPQDLSSGEQHQLVLLYELLFKVKQDSLVLIDEPELSLHIGWQKEFLKDLQEVTKLVNLDFLLATHSPDIIQDRWDLAVELQG